MDSSEVNRSARISVVLASYNGEQFIGAQLRSLLAVMDANDEIVVSDDGSTDDTRAVVASIQDARIRLLPPGPRLGYQGNFARAISAARGKYIFFSDQDDICLPKRVEQSLAALETAACVCGDATVVDSDLRTTSPSYFLLRKPRGFSAWSLLVRPAVIGATMACRREFLEAAMPFPRNIPHDQWLSVLAASRRQLTVISTPFILYRRHAGVVSFTGVRSRRSLWTILSERARLSWALFTRFSSRRSWQP
jgi:glycosyltransferase involved in cell wall biosynthesis